MKRLLSILLCVFALSSYGLQAQRLVILHVNDTHSHLDPERSSGRAGHGGVIERAAYIDSVRHAYGKSNVLLLHAGDWDQGSPYFTIFGGDLEADLVNALGYDCLCFGNHEFDNGIEDLARRVKTIKAPVVCANYDFSGFDIDVRPYAVVKKGGLKIGIVGAICNLSSVVGYETYSRLPAIEGGAAVFNHWASVLRNEEKCDMVILLSHMGYDEDKAMAPSLSGFDIIVGGHSHTTLKDLVYCTDADGKSIPVIQDGYWGLATGRIDVE